MKNSKIIVALLVIIIILLVGIIGFGGYKYMSLDKDCNNIQPTTTKEATEKTPTLNSQYITSSYHDNSYNIYAIGIDMVIGYDGELYAMEGDQNEYTVSECVSQLKNGNFKDDVYSCKIETSADDFGLTARKLNIKEEDVYKVILQNNVMTKDAQHDCFVIDKNGKVTLLLYGKADVHEKSKEVFKNYKVQSIKESCIRSTNGFCDAVEYALTLQDGATKTVTSLD